MKKNKFTFSEDQKKEMRVYFNEGLKEGKEFLTLKKTVSIFQNSFGINNYPQEEMTEYLKNTAVLDDLKFDKVDNIPISFDLFLELLSRKMIKSSDDIPIEEVLHSINLDGDDVISVSELKYFIETKLGEKLTEEEVKAIFNVVTQDEEISISELGKIVKNKFLLKD